MDNVIYRKSRLTDT